MRIEVVELTKNSELVELSIYEQIKVKGGILRVGNSYELDLKNYAEGKSNISSSGDIVTFTPLSQPSSRFSVQLLPRSYKNGKQVDTNGKEIIFLT